MLKKVLLASLLALSPLKAGDPWTKTEVALEVTYQTILFIDWKQTSSFHNNTYTDANGVEHSIGERNMMLGSHPKQATINLFCLASALGHFFISNTMDHKDRVVWQGATIVVQAYAVGNNYRAGVKIQW